MPDSTRPDEVQRVSIEFHIEAADQDAADDIVRTHLERAFADRPGPLGDWEFDAGPPFPDGWDALADTGVLTRLAATFPPPPDPAEHPSSTDTSTLEFEAWVEDCSERVAEIEAMPGRRDEVARLEGFRDQVTHALAAYPIPREPDREDYLVGMAPSYPGEFFDQQYQWDHNTWKTEMRETIASRERLLQDAVSDLDPEAGPAGLPRVDRAPRAQAQELAAERAKTARGWTVLDDVVRMIARSQDGQDPNELLARIRTVVTNGGTIPARAEPPSPTREMLERREDALTTDPDARASTRGQAPEGPRR
ncbi:hypothetical protein VVR84_14075 [Kocuria carniphila]|uniref:Uncharacterized protein n=1 Tax=Kocuria carniphila TaxID=262208 RepID=A0ABV3V8J5_9MICC